MIYICNAFSGNMVPENCLIRKTKLSLEGLKTILAKLNEEEIKSAVGHEDTAKLFTNLLGFPVEKNRINVALDECDGALVGQISGGRLPEGCTTLPEGIEVNWYLYSWMNHDNLAI